MRAAAAGTARLWRWQAVALPGWQAQSQAHRHAGGPVPTRRIQLEESRPNDRRPGSAAAETQTANSDSKSDRRATVTAGAPDAGPSNRARVRLDDT